MSREANVDCGQRSTAAPSTSGSPSISPFPNTKNDAAEAETRLETRVTRTVPELCSTT